MPTQTILVPVDFSEDSLRAVDHAVDLVARLDGKLILLYVVEPVYYATPADMYATSPNLALLLDEQRKVGKEQLARLEESLRKKAKGGVRTLLKTGSPAQVIVDTAKQQRATMIVMATHGRTGLAHVLLGSVAERVVRLAECPVLTVRRKPGRRR